jgi:hypothetical protein
MIQKMLKHFLNLSRRGNQRHCASLIDLTSIGASYRIMPNIREI